MVRQKELLLEEMQHRVSNSLQIIASILLMKARAVSSEAHLHDAHKRVLAVAAVQKHLHPSVGGEPIQLESYLIQLCASLGGAMIPEGKDAIVMTVHVSGGRATSGVAVSLGLIITELVINALKHAFPVQKPDNVIHVAYDADDPNWALSVTDNGVGKAHLTLVDEKGGLGARIIIALASQPDARVTTNSGGDGTSVSIIQGESSKAA